MAESEFDKAIKSIDKFLKPLVVIFVVYLLIMVTVGVRQVFVVGNKIDRNVKNTQTIINDNQRSAIEARKANIQRQQDLTGYIKCLVLLRYDRPDITPTSPRQDTEDALDKCAASTAE